MTDSAVAGPAVEVCDLVKRYPKRPSNAVDGISFRVRHGEVFGLLGPNGAGKTTTVGVLTTRVRATAGTATVAGVDVRADPAGARRVLAVVPQRPNLDRSLSARQNLLFSAAYHGVSRPDRTARADGLLDRFGLGDRGGDKVDRYSGGQAQRLMIARALMHDPQVLFLDEPSTGLDPQARLFVWDRVRELRDSGVTVVLTTHDMDEAEQIADRVGIVDHGKLLALDSPGALVDSVAGSGTVELSFRPPGGAGAERADGDPADGDPVDGADGDPADGAGDGAVEGVVGVLRALDGVTRVERVFAAATGAAPGARVRVSVGGDPASRLGALADAVTRSGAALTDAHVGRPSLQDVFIGLTGRDLR